MADEQVNAAGQQLKGWGLSGVLSLIEGRPVGMETSHYDRSTHQVLNTYSQANPGSLPGLFGRLTPHRDNQQQQQTPNDPSHHSAGPGYQNFTVENQVFDLATQLNSVSQAHSAPEMRQAERLRDEDLTKLSDDKGMISIDHQVVVGPANDQIVIEKGDYTQKELTDLMTSQMHIAPQKLSAATPAATSQTASTDTDKPDQSQATGATTQTAQTTQTGTQAGAVAQQTADAGDQSSISGGSGSNTEPGGDGNERLGTEPARLYSNHGRTVNPAEAPKISTKDVVDLQNKLHVKADGYYGPDTQAALKKVADAAGVKVSDIDFNDDNNPALKAVMAKLDGHAQAPVALNDPTVSAPNADRPVGRGTEMVLPASNDNAQVSEETLAKTSNAITAMTMNAAFNLNAKSPEAAAAGLEALTKALPVGEDGHVHIPKGSNITVSVPAQNGDRAVNIVVPDGDYTQAQVGQMVAQQAGFTPEQLSAYNNVAAKQAIDNSGIIAAEKAATKPPVVAANDLLGSGYLAPVNDTAIPQVAQNQAAQATQLAQAASKPAIEQQPAAQEIAYHPAPNAGLPNMKQSGARSVA